METVSSKGLEAPAKTAYLFPGQGSQYVGMGRDLYEQSRSARRVFQEVDEALGTHFSRILFEGPEELLRRTENAQPAIVTVSMATLKAMEEELGPEVLKRPSLVAGHSLGEYTALVVAGVLDFYEAIRLVRERGRLMQEASERSPGGMAAILGLDEVTVEEICLETGVQIANVNGDDQIIVSGDRLSLARAMDLATARGAKKTIPLAVSGAFHSSLMWPARERFAETLARVRLRDPRIPIVANCTGRPLTTPRQIEVELLNQICRCVQWKRSVHYMLESGVSSFVEIGPGRVLSSLIKRINREVEVVSVGDTLSIRKLAV